MRFKTWMAVICLSASMAAAEPVIAERGVVSAGTAAPGSGVARGSAFVIRGTALGPDRTVKADVPVGEELEGVQVVLQSRESGEETRALVVEASAKRIIAIAPSRLGEGNYEVRVVFQGEASKPALIRITDRNPGIVTTTFTNAGMASAQVGEGEPHAMRYVQPALAGQLIRMDAAGFGPAEDDAGFPGEQSKFDEAIVVVGEVEVPVSYAGRRPDRPGFDQVVFRLPEQGIQPSCVVPVVLKVSDYQSEPAFLAIGESAEKPCTHPGGLDEIALRELDRGGTIVIPAFQITDSRMEFTFEGTKFETRSRGVGGSFLQYDQQALDQSGLAYFSRYAKNGCQVVSYAGEPIEVGNAKALDAGDKILVSGSSGFTNALDRSPDNDYALELNGSGVSGLPFDYRKVKARLAATQSRKNAAILDILPGDYNLIGYGGADITEFLGQLKLSEPVAWSNREAVNTIDRGLELQITWTPGPPADSVTVTGLAGVAEETEEGAEPRIVGVMFTCESPADRGSLTVPFEVLQRMPSTAGLENAMALLSVAHTNRSPNGDFRAETRQGKATEKGNFGFSYSWAKTVEFQ